MNATPIPDKAGGDALTVDGRQVRITNPDKVLYPLTGTTKADVISYYLTVASHLLPYTTGRAATLKRWVHGVGTPEHPGTSFFQKNTDRGPDWLHIIPVDVSDHANHHVDVRDDATLAWLGQIAALEIHVPQWRARADGSARPPDRMVFDLDPGPGMGLPECVQVAHVVRQHLEDLGFDDVLPVTSGSKGIHLYCSLHSHRPRETTRDFAHALARLIERQLPTMVVSDMSKAKRNNRVLIDWSQNHPAKTTIAPFSLRGRPEPMVAAPRTWEELDDPGLAHLTYEQVLARITGPSAVPPS